jgi:hypothetical protein
MHPSLINSFHWQPISQAARSRAAGLASSQEEQDRILATLLQDQLFMEGLRQNPSLLDARGTFAISDPYVQNDIQF